MPELPEVEVLVRHLQPLLLGKTIRAVEVKRGRVVRPGDPDRLRSALRGATFVGLKRRGKYLLFALRRAGSATTLELLGHLGMTGRMYLLPATAGLPRHAAVVLHLGSETFVFEDTRYFGRMSLETGPAKLLGPEPLQAEFTAGYLRGALRRSRQPVKVKLMDQALVAGIGNIYASEALYRARVSPLKKCAQLNADEVRRVWVAIRYVIRHAIRFGSTVPLDFVGTGADRLFYYGQKKGSRSYEERLLVYDRAGMPCAGCHTPIRRIVQAGRSTFYCPVCQGRTRRTHRVTRR